VDLFPYAGTFGYSIAVTGSNQSDTNFYIEQTDALTTYSPRIHIAPNGFIGLNGASVTTNPLAVGTNSATGNGAFLSPGGVWTSASSRAFKEDFADIDTAGILAKVVALPVQSWFYRDDHAEGRHLGPVAEDFMTSFGLGSDDTHIGSVDESGVALAAIQGLNKELQGINKKLEAENAELRDTLGTLSSRLSKLEESGH
jgi:Chaperone of endosialidase